MKTEHDSIAKSRELAAEAVIALIREGRLSEPFDMEKYGCYADLVGTLYLVASDAPSMVLQTWNDLMLDRKEDLQAIAALVEPAIDTGPMVRMSSLKSTLHQWHEQGGPPQGMSTGWKGMDRIYRVGRNEVTLITGAPSAGKSTFMSAMLINLVKAYGWNFVVFTPEQSPPERFAMGLVQQYVEKPFRVGSAQRMTLPLLDAGLDQLNKCVSVIWSEVNAHTLDFLLSQAETEWQERGIQGLIIDPWNDVDHSHDASLREDLYLGSCLTRLRIFARTHNVHVWIIAHPKQLVKDGSGNYPVPGPYDISGGAKWRDKADNILALWRKMDGEQETKRVVQVHTHKIRFSENGEMGEYEELYYNPSTGIYTDFGG